MATPSYGTGKYIVHVGGVDYRYRSLKEAKAMARSMSKEHGGRVKVIADIDGRETPLVGYERGRPINV